MRELARKHTSGLTQAGELRGMADSRALTRRTRQMRFRWRTFLTAATVRPNRLAASRLDID